MKPVNQTKLGYPDGNCFAAAVASILEIGLDDVPYFGNDDQWFERFRTWCISTHALEPMMYYVDDDHTPAGFHLMGGLSPRGALYHCVVGFAGDMVHDPHPDGVGLRERKTFTVFAVLDPRIVPENGARNDGHKCDVPGCAVPTGMLSLAGVAIEMGDLTFCSEHCHEIWWDLHGEPAKV